MNTPRLYSCWFDVAKGRAWPVSWYERHARVLEHSARKSAGRGWAIEVVKIAQAPNMLARRGGGGSSTYSYNTYKLQDWNRVVQAAPEGERLLVCDADLMVLGELGSAWSSPFDVAITVKRSPLATRPINAGVVFLRINDRSRAWFRAWLDWNMRLFQDAKLHALYWQRYAGMNQAALGALLENGGYDLAQLLELPCEQWNCESETWDTFNPAAPPRIVHVKGGLRRGVMDPRTHGAAIAQTARRQLAAEWTRLEREAQQGRAAS